MRTLRLVHLFPDLLNLYGDYANLLVLQRELSAMGAEVEIVPFTGEEDFDFSDTLLVYAGPGTERRIGYALERLEPFREKLSSAREEGVFFLFCGSGAELPAQKIILPNGESIQGLGLAPYNIRRTEKRQTGDCLMVSGLSEKLVVGFLNKSGSMEGVPQPFFRMRLGEGGIINEKGQPTKTEGYADQSFLATYCIGPLLSKNPWLRKLVASKLFDRAFPGKTPLVVPQDVSETAYQITADSLSRRLGT